MIRLSRPVLMLTLILSFLASGPVYGDTPLNKLTEAEKRSGWKLLFDDTSTENWRNYRKDSISKGWVVKDGTLQRAGGDAGEGQGLGAGRDELPELLVMNREPDRIALAVKEMAERSGRGGPHLELAEGAGPVGHRGARIEHEQSRDIGLFLVALDIVAVHASEDLPVEMAQVIAGNVFAMLNELHAEAVAGALVLARQEAIDDALGYQLQTRKTRNELRVEESFG